MGTPSAMHTAVASRLKIRTPLAATQGKRRQLTSSPDLGMVGMPTAMASSQQVEAHSWWTGWGRNALSSLSVCRVTSFQESMFCF